MKQANLGDSY